MLTEEVIDILRHAYLHNISNQAQSRDETLITTINTSLTTIHNLFVLKLEQAIVIVPERRKTFRLINSDPNVLMASYAKIANGEINMEHNVTKKQMFQSVLIRDGVIAANELFSGEEDKTIFQTYDEEIMTVLNVRDSKKREYVMNEKGIFFVNNDTFYFPEVSVGDVIYVEYKPKPRKCRLGEHIDLTDELLDLLCVDVTLKLVATINTDSQIHPNILAMRDRLIREATDRAINMGYNLASVKNPYFLT